MWLCFPFAQKGIYFPIALGMKDLQLFPWHSTHTGMTLLQPKGYLTQSMRAWGFGRSNISEHSSVWGGTKRERYRTRLGWWLHLRDAQLLLYLQMQDLGKKWPKTIKMLTILVLVPSCLLSPPCLHSRAFVWIPKAGKNPRTFRDQHCIIHSGKYRRRHLSWISSTCICKNCMRGVQNRIDCTSEHFQ